MKNLNLKSNLSLNLTRLSKQTFRRFVISSAIGMACLQSCAFAQSINDSLYQDLGQKAGIAKIVQDFLGALAEDGRIKQRFAEADLERLGFMLTDQFCELSGGPCKYSGKDMLSTHAGMNIRNAEFNALAEDLQLALDKNHIPSQTQNRLIAKLAPMQRVVVGK